jgi:hypothetical protein
MAGREIQRCAECKGVAPGQYASTMAAQATTKFMVRELARVGAPVEVLKPVQDWATDEFRGCECPRASPFSSMF